MSATRTEVEFSAFIAGAKQSLRIRHCEADGLSRLGNFRQSIIDVVAETNVVVKVLLDSELFREHDSDTDFLIDLARRYPNRIQMRVGDDPKNRKVRSHIIVDETSYRVEMDDSVATLTDFPGKVPFVDPFDEAFRDAMKIQIQIPGMAI